MELASPTKLTSHSSIADWRRVAKRITLHEVICVAVLAMLMVGLWSVVYDVTNFSSLDAPRIYGGDSLWNLGLIKAYRDGEITPWAFQNVPSLDAPFKANWNDYPTSEKMLPFCIGIAARFVGLNQAFNLAALMAMILAAISFYVACRMLRYQWMFSFAGATMFGFSHYLTARFLPHLTLSYYWHVPLYLVVTWWCFDSRQLPIRSYRWWFAVCVGAITGLLAIYYAFVFWQFLCFAIVAQALRRNTSKLISIFSIAAISIGFTLLMAVPHLLYEQLYGPNAVAAQRTLANLQVFGMQLPDLFMPPFHRWQAFLDFSRRHYFQASLIQGEIGFSYLGVIGIIGFLWLMGLGMFRILQGRSQLIPITFWQSLWIVLFSLIGGVNLLLGVCGLQLFRGTNRFSIILLCLALFFLVKQLGRICPHHLSAPLALGIVVGGLWDILPPFESDQEVISMQKAVDSDRVFVQTLERLVPPGTTVFQIPVMDFPEVPPHVAITDYTYLRPYLYSKTLRFSYGADKGRPREAWQHEVESFSPREMAAKLERYGFGAIVLDRRGYLDAGAGVLNDLAASGRNVIGHDDTAEFVAVALHPKASVVAPDIPPFPGTGFYGWEGDWRQGAQSWSQGDASLVLTNASISKIEKQYTFLLGTLSKRLVTVITPSGRQTLELNPGTTKTAGPYTLQLPPGETQIHFKTDAPPVPAGGADPRQLAFSVAIQPEPSHEPTPILGTGFYGWEGDWRKGAHSWSQGSSQLVLNNTSSLTVTGEYGFLLNTTSQRHVTVITPTESKTVNLTPGNTTSVGPFNLQLAPGQTPIRFETDRPAVSAGPGDPRKITFSLVMVPGPDGFVAP